MSVFLGTLLGAIVGQYMAEVPFLGATIGAMCGAWLGFIFAWERLDDE